MISFAQKRMPVVDVLAILFGISAWISINGLWVELPLLVEKLPESWALASYLSIIVQIANIGPITYSLVRWVTRGQLSQRLAIYFLLSLGAVASLLMALFWDETSVILGNPHSTALFVLVFFLSLVDCTSSILFLPFMAIFRDIYLYPYLVGEGLSGFLPAVVALTQGVGGNPYCANRTIFNETTGTNVTESFATTDPPRFSVDVFFAFLTVMMVISFVAFLLLNYLPSAKKEYAANHIIMRQNSASSSKASSTEDVHLNQRIETRIVREENQVLSSMNTRDSMTKQEYLLILGVQAFVCFWSNGAFPSIQTYSCLPYGNIVYHLSVTLNSMSNPAVAFLAFFVPCKSLRVLGVLVTLGCVFAGFLLATALYSPDMLLGQTLGGFLTVASWIAFGGLFSYVKVSIAGLCRQHSDSALFWCGAVTQMGSALGALIMFILVNVKPVFQQYYVTCD